MKGKGLRVKTLIRLGFSVECGCVERFSVCICRCPAWRGVAVMGRAFSALVSFCVVPGPAAQAGIGRAVGALVTWLFLGLIQL